jgi:hypothetical protein
MNLYFFQNSQVASSTERKAFSTFPLVEPWKSSELVSSHPRPAVLKMSYVGMMLGWLALALGLSGLIGNLFPSAIWVVFLAFMERSRRKSKLLVTKGVMTRGVFVSATEIEEEAESIFTHDYRVVYGTPTEFYTLSFSGHQQVTKHSVGDVVPVLYLPEHPERGILYEDAWHKIPGFQPQIDNYIIKLDL